MANVLTDDQDELELEDEQRKKQAAQTIGSMPRPNPSPPQTLPASMPPPDVGAASPPSPQTISEVAPYNPPAPPAPRPESQAFTDWQAQDLAKHPVGRPRYSGLTRAADTIANMTWPGQLAEEGGEFGTRGAEAKSKRLAGNAAGEDTQIKYGEQEREATGREEEQAARTATEKTGAEVQQLPLPGGGTAGVMTSKIGAPATAIINTAGRQGVADTNADARRDVADTNAGAREETARINVGGKEYGTKEIVSPSDGKPHLMMWNQNTHSYDKDLGEAPPKQAASSAYANTRTINLLDPETGIPTTYQMDPATQTYSKRLGASATGAYGHEEAQAGAVERQGKQLIDDIKTHREALGTLQTWVEKYGLNTPIADPELARLQSELSTFAALQPAMHGFRARSAMEAFQNIIGGLQNNPDATIASIEGILQTAGNIRGKGIPAAPNATGGPVSAGPQKFEDWVKTQGAH